MLRKIFIGKIHRAKVTGAELNYAGSIKIDSELLQAANMLPGEYVDIYNINNGNRFSTYVIEGEPGKKEIVLNGAAARKVTIGDLIIIVNFGYFQENEINGHNPKVVQVDENNNII